MKKAYDGVWLCDAQKLTPRTRAVSHTSVRARTEWDKRYFGLPLTTTA